MLSSPIPVTVHWHHLTSWSICEEKASSQVYLKPPCGFLIPPKETKEDGLCYSEDGLAAVNYDNNHQSNAEEFREERARFTPFSQKG